MASKRSSSTSKATPSKKASPVVTQGRSVSPSLKNKSGLPHLIIPSTDSYGRPAYSPSSTYLAAKKETATRAYVPPVWITRWMGVTFLFTAWILISMQKGGNFKILTSYLHALNIPVPAKLGAGVVSALTILGYSQIVITALYFWLAVALESASANVVAFSVNLAIFTELLISTLAVWSTSKSMPLSSLATQVTPGVATLAFLLFGTLLSIVTTGQRLAFANAMSK